MRQIKFRAFDKGTWKWLKAVPLLEDLLDDEDAAISHHDVDDEAALYFYPEKPLGPDFGGRIVYQQFTGIIDIEGKEVFEGDFVLFTTGKEEMGKVVFSNYWNGWAIELSKNNEGVFAVHALTSPMVSLSCVRVITNIFEP